MRNVTLNTLLKQAVSLESEVDTETVVATDSVIVEAPVDEAVVVVDTTDDTEVNDPEMDTEELVKAMESLKDTLSTATEWTPTLRKLTQFSMEQFAQQLGIEPTLCVGLESMDSQESTITLIDRWLAALAK